jgi:hypothetical protein
VMSPSHCQHVFQRRIGFSTGSGQPPVIHAVWHQHAPALTGSATCPQGDAPVRLLFAFAVDRARGDWAQAPLSFAMGGGLLIRWSPNRRWSS